MPQVARHRCGYHALYHSLANIEGLNYLPANLSYLGLG